MTREIGQLLGRAESPALVALDGPSGAGKTTLAVALASELSAAHVPSDDFYSAEVTDAEWDALSPAGRAERAIDWRRLRRDALEPLLSGEPARWQPFDFESGTRPDGSYGMHSWRVERAPSRLILLDGAYSSRPELSDLISLSVLVDAPRSVRRARQGAREDPVFLAAWLERWVDAEEHYFEHVRPRSSFDLVISV